MNELPDLPEGFALHVAPPPAEGYRVSAESTSRPELEISWISARGSAALFGIVLGGAVSAIAFWMFKQLFSETITNPIGYICPVIGLVPGLLVLYAAFAAMINRRRLTVRRGVLRIFEGPIPMWGSKRVDFESVRAVVETSRVVRNGRPGSPFRSTTEYFGVAVRTDARTIDLVRGLRSREEASYITTVLKRHRGLVTETLPTTP